MDVSNPDLHAFNVEAAIGYVLKEAGPEVAAQYQYSVQRLQPGERRIFYNAVLGQRRSYSARYTTGPPKFKKS